MRIVLLGAKGMLAHDLLSVAPRHMDIASRTSGDLDVTDGTALEQLVDALRPHTIINCAAYTNVNGAESERERAFQVNGRGPGLIGRAARAVNAFVIHYSTDYVFDGTAREPYREEHPTAPLGAYGASKLEGEKALADSGARYLIIRTQWLFGLHGASFPRAMWERTTKGVRTRVVNDQVGRPTYTIDLARATWRLLVGEGVGRGESGILHIANSRTSTWYDVAKRIFKAARAESLLEPCTTGDYPTPARRPAWSVLDTSRYERLGGSPLPPWEDAVDRFLAELQVESSRTSTS